MRKQHAFACQSELVKLVESFERIFGLSSDLGGEKECLGEGSAFQLREAIGVV